MQMSIGTDAPWQIRSPQQNILTSVKRQVINFMMQKPNTGKWRENNSAVSNSARPHPSTQPLKKPLFTHLKVFLLSWLLLFPRLQNHRHRPFRWGWRALCCMIYDPNSEVRLRVTDGQMGISYVCVLDQVMCLSPQTFQILAQQRQIFPTSVMQLVRHSFSSLPLCQSMEKECN